MIQIRCPNCQGDTFRAYEDSGAMVIVCMMCKGRLSVPVGGR